MNEQNSGGRSRSDMNEINPHSKNEGVSSLDKIKLLWGEKQRIKYVRLRTELFNAGVELGKAEINFAKVQYDVGDGFHNIINAHKVQTQNHLENIKSQAEEDSFNRRTSRAEAKRRALEAEAELEATEKRVKEGVKSQDDEDQEELRAYARKINMKMEEMEIFNGIMDRLIQKQVEEEQLYVEDVRKRENREIQLGDRASWTAEDLEAIDQIAYKYQDMMETLRNSV